VENSSTLNFTRSLLGQSSKPRSLEHCFLMTKPSSRIQSTLVAVSHVDACACHHLAKFNNQSQYCPKNRAMTLLWSSSKTITLVRNQFPSTTMAMRPIVTSMRKRRRRKRRRKGVQQYKIVRDFAILLMDYLMLAFRR
jgi:hypothetical protein